MNRVREILLHICVVCSLVCVTAKFWTGIIRIWTSRDIYGAPDGIVSVCDYSWGYQEICISKTEKGKWGDYISKES